MKITEKVGYSVRYGTYYDNLTGEWLEKIGFCPSGDNCQYCQDYEMDGRPSRAFEAPEFAIELNDSKDEE